MTITVAPQVAFHIELTWDLDNSDLDLHYTYPGGNLFGPLGGDCYFGFPNPPWGGSGTDDDPRLDVDNIAGYGPENINMDLLYDDSPFTIYVHYYGGNGEHCFDIADQATCDADPICTVYTTPTGSACVGIPTPNVTPRIRVYVAGSLTYEAYSPTPLNCDELWTVGEVTVSGNGTSVNVSPVSSITPNQGNGSCP